MHPASHARRPRRPAARHLAARRLAARLLVALLVAAPAAATGCAPRQDAEGEPRPEREPTTLLVDNRSFLDHNVYVLRGSQRIRLGTATGNRSQRFTIPANLVFGVTSLRFVVDPIGGTRTPVSDEIRVTEGDEVRLVIPPG